MGKVGQNGENWACPGKNGEMWAKMRKFRQNGEIQEKWGKFGKLLGKNNYLEQIIEKILDFRLVLFKTSK